MFVLDRQNRQVYAYKMTENEFSDRDSDKDFAIPNTDNDKGEGLWGDADNIWVAEDDATNNRVFAYSRSSGSENTNVDFPREVIDDVGNDSPRGL